MTGGQLELLHTQLAGGAGLEGTAINTTAGNVLLGFNRNCWSSTAVKCDRTVQPLPMQHWHLGLPKQLSPKLKRFGSCWRGTQDDAQVFPRCCLRKNWACYVHCQCVSPHLAIQIWHEHWRTSIKEATAALLLHTKQHWAQAVLQMLFRSGV